MAMSVGGGGGRRRRGSRRHGGASAGRMSDINVTPFVDVMLVLLIVFMVAAPLLTAGVPIDLLICESTFAAKDQHSSPQDAASMMAMQNAQQGGAAARA